MKYECVYETIVQPMFNNVQNKSAGIFMPSIKEAIIVINCMGFLGISFTRRHGINYLDQFSYLVSCASTSSVWKKIKQIHLEARMLASPFSPWSSNCPSHCSIALISAKTSLSTTISSRCTYPVSR